MNEIHQKVNTLAAAQAADRNGEVCEMNDTPETDDLLLEVDYQTAVPLVDLSRKLERERDAAQAERDAALRDAKDWKRMAEYYYSKIAYPDEPELAEGALDVYFKHWRKRVTERITDMSDETEVGK
jgi:hypothetical protein